MMMPQMLRQIVWCLDSGNLEKLVRAHRRLKLGPEDFEPFHMGLMMTLKEKVNPSEEAVLGWEIFLRVVFSRWTRALQQQQQLSPKASPKAGVKREAWEGPESAKGKLTMALPPKLKRCPA